MRQRGAVIDLKSAPQPPEKLEPGIRRYLRLDDRLDDIYAEITGDSNVAAQVERYPGLRVLRQEPWECLVAYICSANSNIETIHLNMERLSDTFGSSLALNGHRRHTFPTPLDLAEAGEMELRKLKLGFRAPYVHRAAIAVVEGRLDLDYLVRAPYQ